MTAGELPNRVFQDAVHLGGRVVLEESEDGGGAVFALTKNTEQGDDG